jgi:prephenate dehydrogenase
MTVNTVAIVGVGLIGGSFALALRASGFKGRITGVSSAGAIQEALARGIIDEGLPLADAAAQADLVYLARPIEAILSTLDELDAYLRPGTLVTDAGSTKAVICARAAENIHRGKFVGGHPMAGKQSRGVAEAEASLFQGRPYILTESCPELEAIVAQIRARLVIMPAQQHDVLVAFTSHLPQLLSTALAITIPAEAARVAGPAAQDMTRLALSPYDIWRDIFSTNVSNVDAALSAFIARLESLRTHLNNPAMAAEFDRAAAAAQALRK